MPFCQQCGSQASSTAQFCFNCGADIAAPAASLKGLSLGWLEKFAALQKGGGVDLPQSIELTLGERSKVLFNIWAFLFGPLYYLAKGMWKKALSLSAIALALCLALRWTLGALGLGASHFATLSLLIGPALFATRANVDYFKKMVLGDNGWV